MFVETLQAKEILILIKLRHCYFDASRPTKKKAIVLETDFKIYKRLWVTPESHAKSLSVLKN